MVKIGKSKFRSLIDSGASVSLLHRRIFKNLQDPPKLINKKVYLQSVNESPLEVDGLIELDINIGGNIIRQPFYVVSTMNRNMILGRDFLTTQGVRLYFD